MEEETQDFHFIKAKELSNLSEKKCKQWTLKTIKISFSVNLKM